MASHSAVTAPLIAPLSGPPQPNGLATPAWVPGPTLAGGRERRRSTLNEPQLLQLDAVGGTRDVEALRTSLMAPQAFISPRFFYDALGGRLFESICELPEYYPTRTEIGLFDSAGAEIAALTGTGGVLIDLGAGNCDKAQRLFAALQPSQYVAVDLSVDLLRPILMGIAQRHGGMSVVGIGADLSLPLALPPVVGPRRIGFYPGSSIGNFGRTEAIALLARLRGAINTDGWLLIGFDLQKDTRMLRPAYDDPLQVTAAFNRNVLRHVNRVLASDFDVAHWRHEVRCQPSRVQMHLQATRDVVVRWPGHERRFHAGDCIHTEDSNKYSIAEFGGMLAEAGLREVRCWKDSQQWFALMLARVDA